MHAVALQLVNSLVNNRIDYVTLSLLECAATPRSPQLPSASDRGSSTASHQQYTCVSCIGCWCNNASSINCTVASVYLSAIDAN